MGLHDLDAAKIEGSSVRSKSTTKARAARFLEVIMHSEIFGKELSTPSADEGGGTTAGADVVGGRGGRSVLFRVI